MRHSWRRWHLILAVALLTQALPPGVAAQTPPATSPQPPVPAVLAVPPAADPQLPTQPPPWS